MAEKLFEVVVRGEYFDQETINRFNYVGNNTPASVSDSFALCSALGGILDEGSPDAGTLIYQWGLIVVDSFNFVDIFVRDVYSDTDFYQTPMVFAGSVAQQAMPVMNAYGFYSNRTNLSIRRGMKRLAGIGEGASDPGGNLTAGTITALNALATKMTATVSYDDEGNTLNFSPVIVSKEKYDPATGDADPDGTAYRYYDSVATQLTHVARSLIWTPYTTVRTQNSRQYGRGR